MNAYVQDIIDLAGDEVMVSRSNLACHVCKRRKSKCDRTLPSCSTCLKSGQPCEYPGAARKPGPKTGMCHRSKRRNRNDVEADDQGSSRLLENMRSGQGNLVNHLGPNSMSTSPSFLQRTQSTGPEYRSSISDPLGASGLPSPVSTITTTPSYESCERKNNTLMEIIHPSHEPAPQPRNAWDQQEFESQEGTTSTAKQIIISVCEGLHISTESYHYLLTMYFENMMSFSLFHRPSFDAKLRKISSQLQAQALLAAMFSFSARFCELGSAQQHIDIPSPEYFHGIAVQLISDALEECSENAPPLCVLQAMILTTFQQLVNGVRGRAWRSLGMCIRIAYELELHLIDQRIDQDSDTTIGKNVGKWISEEERRRAWWTLWEFDVFASTIRRLPTGIDWIRNETYLPVDDEFWLAGKFQPSCHLAMDPHQRWKSLEKSGNKSGKAWYLVINSLMRSAQSIWGSSRRNLQPVNKSKGDSTPISKLTEEAANEMSIVSDALCCFTMALPLNLTHRGEFLSFRAGKYVAVRTSRQNESDKYSIHIMKQLSRFMVYHHRVFRGAGRDAGNVLSKENSTKDAAAKGPNQGAWSRYLDAADDIIAVIRNSSPDHIQYVNPFLASTIWLAAAAQVASRMFGPMVTNPKTVESNLDLLRLTFNRFVTFWNLSDTLQEKLSTLESRLQTLISSEHGTVQVGEQAETTTQISNEPHRNDRIEDFASMSSYFPQESAFASPSATSYDPSYPLPASGLNFGGFPMTGYENWDSFELEELLTYGYDGAGVLALA